MNSGTIYFMLREQLAKREVGKGEFRWRSEEISRMEGLSDAVFGFAITLLVVSLEVPKNFEELLDAMRGFFSFAITFVLLFQIWYYQYTYFRRYGLQDRTTILLNAALLFVVLFYVYPLKFLFSVLTSQLGLGAHALRFESSQTATLMLIYSAGFVAIFGIFFLLNLHAYRKRDELELSPAEAFDTRESMQSHLINVVVGVASAIFAALHMPSAAGFVYPLLGIFHTVHGITMGRARRRQFEMIEG